MSHGILFGRRRVSVIVAIVKCQNIIFKTSANKGKQHGAVSFYVSHLTCSYLNLPHISTNMLLPRFYETRSMFSSQAEKH